MWISDIWLAIIVIASMSVGAVFGILALAVVSANKIIDGNLD